MSNFMCISRSFRLHFTMCTCVRIVYKHVLICLIQIKVDYARLLEADGRTDTVSWL